MHISCVTSVSSVAQIEGGGGDRLVGGVRKRVSRSMYAGKSRLKVTVSH